MQVNSNSFTDEVSKILGFDTPPEVSPNNSNQSPLDDFLAFEGGGDPKQNIAERNLIDRNHIVQTGLVRSLETNAANRNSFDYNSIQGVNGNRFVTAEFIRGVEAMAGRLGTRPEYILAVMSFETGGSFNPAIRNGIGATGLIQFLAFDRSRSWHDDRCAGTNVVGRAIAVCRKIFRSNEFSRAARNARRSLHSGVERQCAVKSE